jgi:hypothetical protein
MDKNKNCSACGIGKPGNDFYNRKSTASGIASSCKICSRERNKQYYKNNKNLKKEYVKNLPAGIYTITCNKNGRKYIGCSTELPRRKASHFRNLKKQKHVNRYLQNDYNKYGDDSFEFEVIEEHPNDTSFKELEKREVRLILEYRQKGFDIYNINVKIEALVELFENLSKGRL